jgi:hypothetical protein
MAEKTVFQYFDDLDGAALDVEDLQTVEWSWRGVAYHFDTSTAHLDDIEAGQVSVATLLAKSFRTIARPRVVHDARVGPSLSAGRRRAVAVARRSVRCVRGRSRTSMTAWVSAGGCRKPL